jgi:hypothetical protein
MTGESFKRAEELLPKIAATKTNIDRWEKATSFKGSAEIGSNFPNQNYSYVHAKHIPFDVAKALSLAGYKKELEQLENEFNSL